MKIVLASLAVCSLLATGVAIAGQPAATSKAAHNPYAAAVADSRRPASDKARDKYRKPAQIVKFAGVKPGDTIAELLPGGGWYTRVLAGTVGPKGAVYSIIPAAFADRPHGLDKMKAVAAAYPNVHLVVVKSWKDLKLPVPVDVVWTTENYHDLVAAGKIKAVNAFAYRALKPHGIYFIEDHKAAPGAGTSVAHTLHRIDPASVRKEVTSAGFKLEASSNILHNPNDPHTEIVFKFGPTTDKLAYRFRKES